MALEKNLFAVAPKLFTADGGSAGKIEVANACDFKVKQRVKVSGTALPQLDLEVKRVIGLTEMYLGPITGPISDRTDLSAYTTAASSFIYAIEQKRPSIPFEEFTRAVYEEEPVVAKRVVLVDDCGDKYNTANPLPVSATVNVTAGSKPGTHTIFNELVASANTEVSVILPANTEKITIMARTNRASKIQYSFVSGESGTKFITITPGVRKEINDIGLTGATPLYFQLSLVEAGGTIVEIETWSL